MAIRQERVAEEIRKVISERLIRGLRQPLPGFVAIRAVEVTPDLSIAKVFFSVFGDAAAVKGAQLVLESEKKAIRQEVGAKVRLRIVPEIVLVYDHSSENAARINALLSSVAKDDLPK